MLVLVDIEARKRAELALALAKQQAESATRAKSRLLATVTHELRTPLHAILGFAEVLDRMEGPGAEPAGDLDAEPSGEAAQRRRDLFATIQRNGRHLLTLINEVLDFSGLEPGRLTLAARPTALPALLRDCADPATRDCPVIFLTALGTIEDKARGFAAGGVDYVTKPFDARELLLRITSHLRLARRLFELQDRLLDDAPPVPPDPGSARPARPLELLLRARDTLLANLTDPPDLATLARHCGTNRTSLQRLFKEYLGMTVFGYLREQRLQRARCLLEQGGHSIEAAAAAVGYFDGRDLTRAFKQRFGVGPGALSKVA